MVALCENEEDVSLPLIAKFKALWRVIMLCMETGLTNVIFEGNDMNVIEEVNNLYENSTPHDQLIEDIQCFSRGLSKCKFSYCP